MILAHHGDFVKGCEEAKCSGRKGEAKRTGAELSFRVIQKLWPRAILML